MLKAALRQLINDDGRTMRLLVSLACPSISLTIGFTYAKDIFVNGWQLWSWAACCIVLIGVFLWDSERPSLPSLGRFWLWPLTLFIIALLLRVTFLETIPSGLHVDELGIADFTLRHIFANPGETLNPFITGPASQPSLYHYLLWLSMTIAGKSIFGLRLTSALAGAAGVLATYGLVAVLQNRRAAIITAVIMTTYHYHIHWSRIGLNNIWDTLWVPLMLAPFAWGWRKGWRGGAVLSGIAVGLSQYFYAGGRVGLFLLAFLIFQLWRDVSNQTAEEHPSQKLNYKLLITNQAPLLKYTLTTCLIALCIAGPLFLYALRDPGPFFERSYTVWGWRSETIWMVMGDSTNTLAYGWRQLWRSAGAFMAVPDTTGFYDPGVPLLISLSTPLFVIGLGWALFKKHWLPVLWIFLTTFLGGFLLADPPGSSHYVVAIPAICWLIALPLEWLASIKRERLALVLLTAVIIVDLYFYFVIYTPSPHRDLIHIFPAF